MNTSDVLIIGGGPAGSAAAITATRAGLQATVIDKAQFPRDKTCGDGLTTGALRHLEQLGIRPDTIPSWQNVDDVALVDPSGRVRRFPLPRDRGQFAAVARRSELDAQLLEAARREGATIHLGTTVTGVENQNDRVTITCDDGSRHHGRYTIAADGMWSPTRTLLGLSPPRYRGEWHAFRQYATGARPEAQRELWVWFERDLLPGYIWSFPLGDGSVNVGFGVQRTNDRANDHSGKALADIWRTLVDRPSVRSVLGDELQWEGPARAWPIPARLGRLPRHAGRVVFVGDAAGATDPMTGEGIGQALETAILAVDCLVAAGPDRPHVLADRYTRSLDRSMVVDHRLARTLSTVLGQPAGATLAMAAAGATPWTRRNFARWLFEDYPRSVVATPSRWHRSVFTGAGAFEPGTS